MFLGKEPLYQLVISKLEQMSRYLNTMNLAIQSNQQQLIANLESITKDMGEEEKSNFYDFHEDDMIEAGSDFPTLLFSSFVISWYSFMEYELTSICKMLDLRISVSIKDDTRYGEGIKRAYKFLDEAGGYKIDNKHWQELDKIRSIRNKLVHEGGILLPKPVERRKPSVKFEDEDGAIIYLPIENELYCYLKEHNLYQLGISRFTPNYDYCNHLINFGTEFLKKVYKDCVLST